MPVRLFMPIQRVLKIFQSVTAIGVLVIVSGCASAPLITPTKVALEYPETEVLVWTVTEVNAYEKEYTLDEENRKIFLRNLERKNKKIEELMKVVHEYYTTARRVNVQFFREQLTDSYIKETAMLEQKNHCKKEEKPWRGGNENP